MAARCATCDARTPTMLGYEYDWRSGYKQRHGWVPAISWPAHCPLCITAVTAEVTRATEALWALMCMAMFTGVELTEVLKLAGMKGPPLASLPTERRDR